MDEAAAQDILVEKTKEAFKHLEAGGTMKSFANFSDAEFEAVYSVGQTHFAAGKYDEAADLFKFLCLYDHANTRWFYALGVVQQKRKDYQAALQAYGMATLLDMSDPRPQAQAGYCLMALEKWPEAKSALEGAQMTCGGKPEYANIRTQVENLLTAIPGAAAK